MDGPPDFSWIPGAMRDGPVGDYELWSILVIGTAALARVLREIGDPTVHARSAEVLERIHADRNESPWGDAAVILRKLQAEGERILGMIQAGGAKFDFERGVMLLPQDGPGRPGELGSLAVGAAWERCRPGRRLPQYDQETISAIREALRDVLPPEDLTDPIIKARLQRYAAKWLAPWAGDGERSTEPQD